MGYQLRFLNPKMCAYVQICERAGKVPLHLEIEYLRKLGFLAVELTVNFFSSILITRLVALGYVFSCDGCGKRSKQPHSYLDNSICSQGQLTESSLNFRHL